MRKTAKRAIEAIGKAAGLRISISRISQNDHDLPIHFLHIGKNAGTQIKLICEKINQQAGSTKIKHCNHDQYLKDLPRSAPYFFSIRDPISRFKSGFYSRKRKGMPRIYSEWSAYDEVAFADFEHANDLAESLFEEGAVGLRAFAAAKSIRHTAQNQCDWFCMCGNFLSVRPPIWIIRQEALEKDMAMFLSRSKMSEFKEALVIEKDPIKAHRNDYAPVPDLSEKAKENLRLWYSQDFAFYNACECWMKETVGVTKE